jgi:hypothetical protein
LGSEGLATAFLAVLRRGRGLGDRKTERRVLLLKAMGHGRTLFLSLFIMPHAAA